MQTSQCIDRRIPDKQTLINDVAAWLKNRIANHAKAVRHIPTADARVKLKRLHPSI